MNLTVDTELLKEFGNTINGYGASYLDQVDSLYQTVNALNESWKGTDSDAYVDKIVGYKTDIENLGKAIEDYGKFLIESANGISELRSQIQTESSKL